MNNQKKSKAYNITLIPGDGIGPEVIQAARSVLEASRIRFNWDVQEAGLRIFKKTGKALPDSVINSIRKNKIVFKGPTITPTIKNYRSINVALRNKFDTYAGIRPCKIYPGVQTRYQNINLVIIRENLEDLYAGIEFGEGEKDTEELINFISKKQFIRSDSGISLKIISRFESERIINFAFKYAKENSHHKITIVHKANILKHSDGLFLEIAQKIAHHHPEIEFENQLIDSLTAQLVQNPEKYDLLVCPNLYGDILSDLCAGLVGGLGMCPGVNLGDKYAIFEPVHGAAPQYQGLNKVNPVAAILSGVMMLRYLGELKAADKIEKAVAQVIKEGKFVTCDIKKDSAVGTKEMAKAIVNKL